jgi:hypothetical protein
MAAAPVFTNWDFLDPVSMRAKLKTAHGSDVWDNFSLLSDKKAQDEINALSSTPPFAPNINILDPRWTPDDDDVTLNAPDWSLADAIGAI